MIIFYGVLRCLVADLEKVKTSHPRTKERVTVIC